MDSQTALTQYQQAANSAQNPQQLLQGAQQQYGVGAAQQTVQGLRGAIQNTSNLLQQVAPSVMGRTQNSLVTNAQSNRIIQNEQAPISQQLSKQGQDYQYANSDLSNAENQANEAANLAYKGQQDKLSYLQNLYNTVYSKEQNDRAAQAAEAQRQEQIRQFNAQMASRSSGGGGSGGGGRAPSQASILSNAAGQIESGLRSVKGGDGYVSPQDYAQAYKDWTQAGGDISSFNSKFGYLKNPKNGYYDYAIRTL